MNKKIGRNEPCPCNSGRKYKKCCGDPSIEITKHDSISLESINPKRIHKAKKSPLISEQKFGNLSLYERNILILEAAVNIFDLSNHKWADIKKKIAPEQVRDFYEFVADVWHPETDYDSLLPDPNSSLRALYLGSISPEVITRNIFRIALYTDEIFITDPLHNPHTLVDEFNPIVRPEAYKADTLKILLFLSEIAPWVTAGLVTLIPDPSDFDFEWRDSAMHSASARIKNWVFDEEELEQNSLEGKEDFKRFLYTLPKHEWAKKAKSLFPKITNTEIDDLYAYIQKERAADPLALDQTLQEASGQVTAVRTGLNLETALYLSQKIGAFPFTSLKMKWRELLSARIEQPEITRPWTPLTRAFQDLEFKFLNNVDSRFAYELRADGRLGGFRSYLRRAWKAVEGEPDTSKIDVIARDFRDELTDEYHKAEAEWKEIDRSILQWFGGAISGALLAGGLSFTPPALPALGVATTGIFKLIEARTKRRSFRAKFPMSVFVDLSRHKKRS